MKKIIIIAGSIVLASILFNLIIGDTGSLRESSQNIMKEQVINTKTTP